MTKEFEALERIKEFYPQWRLSNRKDFNLIETALSQAQNDKRELEELQEVLDDFGVFNTFNLIDTLKNIRFLEMQHIIDAKKLKALEIIKEKMVSLDDLNDAIYEDDYHQNNEHNAIDIYNQNRFEYKQLTQEEFDLLKEVLL